MLRRSFSMLALAGLMAFSAQAAEPVSTSRFGNTAIGGQDTVSYHDPAVRQAHKVRAGDKQFEVPYLGASWRFASRDSAERFAADPAKYVPHYNGFCANALALGEGLVRTDGTVWEFFGDQLYLFYGESGRQRWLAGDWKTYRGQADAAWKSALQK